MMRSSIKKERVSIMAMPKKRRSMTDAHGNTPKMRKRLVKAGRCIPHARKNCSKAGCK